MPLEYSIRFRPGRYHVAPVPLQKNLVAVVDDTTGEPVCMTDKEMNAQAICFALELANAQINGDNVKAAEMLKSIYDVCKRQ